MIELWPKEDRGWHLWVDRHWWNPFVWEWGFHRLRYMRHDEPNHWVSLFAGPFQFALRRPI